MKIRKKYVSFMLLLCITMLTFIGCSSPKLTPENSVLALYDLYILGNSSGVLELGMTEEDVATVLDNYNTALTNTLKTSMADAGLTIDDTMAADIINARKEALKNMNVVCEAVSTDDTTAVVVLKTTYFDEMALDKKAADDAIEAAKKSDLTNQDELLAKATQSYVQNLIESYQSVTISEDYKELTVNCVLTDNVWLPEDMAAFGESLGKIIAGQ